MLRRGGVAEYDASWLLLGPSDGLMIGCACWRGGELDGLVASVEPELESELEVEDLWSSLRTELV